MTLANRQKLAKHFRELDRDNPYSADLPPEQVAETPKEETPKPKRKKFLRKK